MSIVLDILTFILVLAVIVIIHEGGHFFFARKANILCREFAFGMGPILVSKKKGETLYSLRAFPIGGFCAIAGEEGEEDPFKNIKTIKLKIENDIIKGFYLDVDDDKVDYPLYNIVSYDIYDKDDTGNLYMEVEKDGVVSKYSVLDKACIYTKKIEYQIAPHNRLLNSKKKWQRALTIFGGPLSNFILAFIVFLFVGLFTGVPENKNVLGKLTEKSPAYNAGLRENDTIIAMSSSSINEKPIENWNDISEFMNEYRTNYYSEEIKVTYLRNNSENSLTVFPSIAINSLGITNTDATGKTTNEVKILEIAKSNSKTFNNAELELDDVITEINGEKVNSWTAVCKFFTEYVGDEEEDAKNWVNLVVSRDGESKTIKVKPYSKEIMDSQVSLSGQNISNVVIYMDITQTTKFSLLNSFKIAAVSTGSSFTLVARTLKLLFSGSVGVSDMSGPVGIYSLTSKVRENGILSVLSLIGMLSVNIGLMNLLPIPALDGGRLIFLGYEAITKKRPSEKLEGILITVTFFLLLALIVYVTYGDILRLLGFR